MHNPRRQDNKLEVSIYFMHTNSFLEFTVEDIYENEKVLFDSTVNMLVIYLPNKYLQLIDCGPEHFAHPLPSMTFYGKYGRLREFITNSSDNRYLGPSVSNDQSAFDSVRCLRCWQNSDGLDYLAIIFSVRVSSELGRNISG